MMQHTSATIAGWPAVPFRVAGLPARYLPMCGLWERLLT